MWKRDEVCLANLPATPTPFRKLSQYPLVVDDGDMQDLQRFVVMMYNWSSTAKSVDGVKLDMPFHQPEKRWSSMWSMLLALRVSGVGQL